MLSLSYAKQTQIWQRAWILEYIYDLLLCNCLIFETLNFQKEMPDIWSRDKYLSYGKICEDYFTSVPDSHSCSNPKKEAPSAGSYTIWLYAFKLWYLQAAGQIALLTSDLQDLVCCSK